MGAGVRLMQSLLGRTWEQSGLLMRHPVETTLVIKRSSFPRPARMRQPPAPAALGSPL